MYQPAFEGAISAWTTKHLKRNQWRLRAICPTWGDLMQEAQMVFIVCRQRYCDTGKVHCMPHFMSLYQVSLTHRLHRLAQKDSRIRSLECAPLNEDDELPEAIGETDNLGVLAVLVRQAPQEVLMVLSLLAGAPNELLELVWGARTTEKQQSKRLGRLLGLPPDCDPLAMTRAHFKEIHQ